MLFFLCIKTNIWNATLDQQPINNHHELVIKLSPSAEMGSGGARKTKKEIHVTEQYKHSGRFGRLLKWINLSSWNKESLWKHKWNRKKTWVKKQNKTLFPQGCKTRVLCILPKAMTMSPPWKKSYFNLSKQEKLFSYSYK